MILANVRRRLTREDAQLALRLVADESDGDLVEAQRRLGDAGLDSILDDPRLPSRLRQSRYGAYASLPLFLYVMVRHALLRAGIRERAVSEYLAEMVLIFGARGRPARIGDGDDEMYESLASLLDDVNDANPQRAFLVRAHLGNLALWLAGLFPDRIEYQRWHRGGPDLGYFDDMGRRGFQLAAEHQIASRYGMTQVYGVVAERFDVLRVALNGLSDTVLFPNVHTPERLMRQVADEQRWRLAG